MAVATETRSARPRAPAREGRPRFKPATLFDLKPLPSERDSTLADVVKLAWVCMQAEGSAPCPVCDAAMDASGCRSCGSRLE